MELYQALDRLRLTIHDSSRPAVSAGQATHATTNVFVGGLHPPVIMPSQTVIVNNGDVSKKDDDKKKDTTVRDNIITGVGAGVVAMATTYLAANLYNRHQQNYAVERAYRDMITTYRTLFPTMPYLNACGVTDLENYYHAWQAETSVWASAKRGAIAAVASIGVIAAWRFGLPAVGWSSFAALTYVGCRTLFDYLTANASAAHTFAMEVKRVQLNVWNTLQANQPAPPPSYNTVD